MIMPRAGDQLLLPVNPFFIGFTLLVALAVNLLPAGRHPAQPDLLAVVLVFWCVHQPLKVGMAAGFVLGLAMDVADASVMGQHALAYVLLAFAAAGWSRRVLWFPLSQQALHVLPMLFGMQLVMLVTRMVSGGEFPGVLWFLSSFTATLLWYPVTYLLLMPQFRPEDKDVHRPI